MVALENDLYPITVWENMENHLQNVRPFRSINGTQLYLSSMVGAWIVRVFMF